MEFINELYARGPELLQSGELIPVLLLIGAGTSIFLIADNGSQAFSVVNGAFVILGYLAGAILTLNGVWMAWEILGPAVQNAAPPAPTQ